MILNLNEYVNMNVILNVTVNLNVNVRGKRECERESECKLNAPNPWPHCSHERGALSQHFNTNEFKRT